MTKEECAILDDDFMPLEYNGFKVYVTPTGRIQSWNGKEFIERKWRLNKDGYPVVAVQDGVRHRSICVHILVANAWIANPLDKPEVNHMDFDRGNPWAYNLEWVAHQENIAYSRQANRWPSMEGENNPNYGNDTLHLRYQNDKEFAKEKQSRPGGRNGKAKSCKLFHVTDGLIGSFEFQRDAVNCLIGRGIVKEKANKESVIHYLKREQGYKGYYLRNI